MRIYKYLILIILFSNFIQTYSNDNPFFKQREFISLAGIWQCELGNIRLPGTVDESRLAPRTKDTLNTAQLTRLHPYEGKMKYTKEIVISSSSADKEWRLVMERTKPSKLWIDEDSIGYNPLVLSPHIYNIGKLSAGKHTICIEIDNSSTSVPNGIMGSHAWTDATQTNWNGIIGRFGLEANEGILMESIHVYPSVSASAVPANVKIKAFEEVEAVIRIKGYTYNTPDKNFLPEQEFKFQVKEGIHSYDFEINLGDRKVLWSEFAPALYKIGFELASNEIRDYLTVDFGIRDFSIDGTMFSINSLTTSLRGKHDACVFPLTGYPPMEKEEWIRQFRISKQYGINHYRFHSWTPPQAAFDAANEEGIYIQAELPFWGIIEKENKELNIFLMREGECILNVYGNNPSFVMMALGNELGGDMDYMRSMVSGFRKQDNRHLYAFGANNALGTGGQQDGEDFLVTCRIRGEVGSSDYSTHTRSTFSFADAKDGGWMNGLYPSTNVTFTDAIADCTVPVISHENGQFQVYPDYKQIEKYTGVLYPYNLKIFKRRLNENNLQGQADIFHKATARFAAICYKEDIEMCLRTPGFGGFQILDLQDYPGQGSAYVGILDAFMENKEGITPEEFSGFCSQIVTMALMPKYCWRNNETFSSEIRLYNYSSHPINDEALVWSLNNKANDALIKEGTFMVNAQQGLLTSLGNIEISFSEIINPTQLKLSLKLGNHTNSYDIWVYPVAYPVNDKPISKTSSLEAAIKLLNEGKDVLFIPDHKEIEQLSVGGMFTPDYWNYAMFKSISESLDRDISPGTLSILTTPSHPLFKEFPTDFHSNWQWWIITKNSRPFILDKTLADYKPLVQVIDNIERNHKLGLIFEMKVGKGKLLISMCNLEAIQEKPEGKQFYQSIINYMSSSDFNPLTNFTTAELLELFTAMKEERDIIGVKNITTYQ